MTKSFLEDLRSALTSHVPIPQKFCAESVHSKEEAPIPQATTEAQEASSFLLDDGESCDGDAQSDFSGFADEEAPPRTWSGTRVVNLIDWEACNVVDTPQMTASELDSGADSHGTS
jgi:hypothetical protein